MKIILGSKSPRRQELLAGMGLEFAIVDINADESYPTTLREGDIPLYISRAKASAYTQHVGCLQEDELLITADTIVWIDGQVLGKPRDEQDACRMLGMLSGKTHQVFTGVTITTAHGMESFVDRTDVTFRPLTADEIQNYVHTYRPLDKAGSYGVQEWIGYVGCESLRGSFYNVMGLPTEPLYRHLQPYLH